MSQLELVGVRRRTPQAHRGRHFQTILNRTHLWYETQRWGKVYEIPNAFSYVPEYLWQRAEPELRGGAPLLRVKGAPDYVGGILGRHVEFDAKEFAGASISVENFKEHQVDKLYASERAGNTAGFMVLEKRTDVVYWVEAGYVRAWLDGLRARRDGVKSLNFSKVVSPRIRRLCQVERDSVAHYAPALIHDFQSRLVRPA